MVALYASRWHEVTFDGQDLIRMVRGCSSPVRPAWWSRVHQALPLCICGFGPSFPGSEATLSLWDHLMAKLFFCLLMLAQSGQIHGMSSTTMCYKVFSIVYELPEQIALDKWPQFTSQEFADFLHSNVITHAQTAPYHPSSNGAVERLVQTFKQATKADRGCSVFQATDGQTQQAPLQVIQVNNDQLNYHTHSNIHQPVTLVKYNW